MDSAPFGPPGKWFSEVERMVRNSFALLGLGSFFAIQAITPSIVRADDWDFEFPSRGYTIELSTDGGVAKKSGAAAVIKGKITLDGWNLGDDDRKWDKKYGKTLLEQ